MPPIIYRIDAQDRLIEVNQAWFQFAEENGKAMANPDLFIGRMVWDFVRDETVREIYTLVLDRVRSGQTIAFRYRCDSPGQRREFDMTITPLDAAGVEFTSTPRAITERTPVPLFDITANRWDAQSFRMCGWCHAIGVDGAIWMPLTAALEQLRLLDLDRVPQITHGICEPCAAHMFDLVE